MPGLLESLDERLARIEGRLDEVAAKSEPVTLQGVPLSEAEEVWSAGAMNLEDATAFSGIKRDELYHLMRTGELPYAAPNRRRVVPRLWFVRFLAAKSNGGAP